MKRQLKQPAYLLLLAAAIVGLPLAAVSVKHEAQLPFVWYTNGLRLFHPESMSEISDAIVNASASGKDLALASYVNCMYSDGDMPCAAKLEPALSQSPADGSIWLEYSRALAREGDTQITALDALDRSFDLSGHESWLIAARTNHVVAVWNGLTDELKQKAKTEVARALPDGAFIDILAQYYIDKPFSHAAIQELVDQATPQQKIRFLGRISAAAKG